MCIIINMNTFALALSLLYANQILMDNTRLQVSFLGQIGSFSIIALPANGC